MYTVWCGVKHLVVLLLAGVLGQLQAALAQAGAHQMGTDVLLLRQSEQRGLHEQPWLDLLSEDH